MPPGYASSFGRSSVSEAGSSLKIWLHSATHSLQMKSPAPEGPAIRRTRSAGLPQNEHFAMRPRDGTE